MYLVVIERNNNISNPDARDRIIGDICHSFDAARELVSAHCERGHDLYPNYIENGTNYDEFDRYTGEIVKEYYVRVIDNIS